MCSLSRLAPPLCCRTGYTASVDTLVKWLAGISGGCALFAITMVVLLGLPALLDKQGGGWVGAGSAVPWAEGQVPGGLNAVACPGGGDSSCAASCRLHSGCLAKAPKRPCNLPCCPLPCPALLWAQVHAA